MNNKTDSEIYLTAINQNVFFKEFTFNKNDFYPNDGKKELADNILWLDDLFFVFQVKERNPKSVKTGEKENKWFEENVLKTAKNQIKDTIEYLQKYKDIPIQNVKGHVFNAADADYSKVNKIIVYMSNSSLLDVNNRNIKFYRSDSVGLIHILHIEDYKSICKYLITPAELDEYFKFRERLYVRHTEEFSTLSESYILSHFLNTDDESDIRQEYIKSFTDFETNAEMFEMSAFLDSFSDKIINDFSPLSHEYYLIIKELAKLKRSELAEFKKRFSKILQHANSNTFSLPYRFTIARTGCGFVLIPLLSDHIAQWENALLNFTSMYKYKGKLTKCVGVIVYKSNSYFNINWTLISNPWIYNAELETAVNGESEYYGESQLIKLERYKKCST